MLLSSWTVGDSATLGTNQYLFTTVTGGPEHDATLSGKPGHILRHSLCSSVTFAKSESSLVCLEAVGHLRPDSFQHDLFFQPTPPKCHTVFSNPAVSLLNLRAPAPYLKEMMTASKKWLQCPGGSDSAKKTRQESRLHGKFFFLKKKETVIQVSAVAKKIKLNTMCCGKTIWIFQSIQGQTTRTLVNLRD